MLLCHVAKMNTDWTAREEKTEIDEQKKMSTTRWKRVTKYALSNKNNLQL